MLRKHILTAGIAVLALGVAGFTLAGCKKKSDQRSGAADGMGAAMDQAPPPGMPVETATGDMGATAMRPVAMDADDAADSDVQQAGQMTLRMLTVGWKESSVAVELKRSKAEARKIIDKALKEAKAKPGEKSFIKLVKKYSDVNKANGGKLPPFAPKDYNDPKIAKAVAPLKVGGLSGIVEAKTGFNIFLRVK